MKKRNSIVWAVAVVLCAAPAFAQHGHGPAGASGMGGASHASANGSRNSGMGTNASSTAAAHGKTMDQILNNNTKLSGKIGSLTGESALQACSGFKNLGQCVAAAHVSKNLGISFACLKSDMTGTAPAGGSGCPTGTGAKSMSLGRSIQALNGNANSKAEAKKGQQQAGEDLKDSTNNS